MTEFDAFRFLFLWRRREAFRCPSFLSETMRIFCLSGRGSILFLPHCGVIKVWVIGLKNGSFFRRKVYSFCAYGANFLSEIA